MGSKHIEMVKKQLVDVVYEHVYYSNTEVTREQVERVLNSEGYDVNPVLIIYIQNVSNAWKHMLFAAESNETDAFLSVDELCLYNRICVSNMHRNAGNIKGETAAAMSHTAAPRNICYGTIFHAVWDDQYSGVAERACGLYCDILQCNLFENGNECVARLMANFYLLVNDAGYFSIPESSVKFVKSHIKSLVTTGKRKQLMNHLLKHAVVGGK